MLRLFLILLLCALFAACSSDDDSANFKKWFDDQGIATSYGKYDDEIDVSLMKDSSGLGYDSSASMVNTFAALGNVNGVEHKLYFGLRAVDKLDSVWRLRTDSIFYANFYEGKIPEEQKNIKAKFYWLKEKETEHDTTWLKLQKEFSDSADVSIDWISGGTRDTFNLSLPEEFLELRATTADTLRLFTGIRLITNDVVLRIAPPITSDISGLLRVAQKTRVESCGDLCLHAGVRESLNVAFEVGKDKIKANKTVVFAQLVLPKSSDTTGSELGSPVPMFVFNEEYRVDTASVKNDGHPNLVFWKGDTLKLQVTRNLRRYVPNTFAITLRLGNPMLDTNSLSFLFPNVFSNRPAYASYNFNTAFEGAKLRLWYAETDIH
ncbi:MAG: hypothetical protein LBC87_02765 [Fibromonadaceae bacterium]|jgi:hypothetical protein|nr:hypothetical protein [Fibromonadaceae bacterium]